MPPTIPTSFVPHSASAAARRFSTDLTGAFGFFAYAVLGFVLVLAIGIFSYSRILVSTQAAKEDELAQATAAIDSATVEGFVQLRDRLSSGQTLLTNHVAFSGFFALLSSVVPTNVRFTALHLFKDDTDKVKLEGAGIARSFNALAVASSAFAADGRVKDAIFSNIVVDSKDGSVSFALSATLDSRLVAFTAAPAEPAPAASSTDSLPTP